MIFAPIQWKKEVIDQPLHALLALALLLAFVLPLPIWLAALLSIAVGVLRELDQHKWNWRAVGRLDLLVWSGAAVVGALIAVLFF